MLAKVPEEMASFTSTVNAQMDNYILDIFLISLSKEP